MKNQEQQFISHTSKGEFLPIFLTALKQNNMIRNTKGGLYYASSYDSNLDFFAGVSRHTEDDEICNKFSLAYSESPAIALASMLYCLDIRGGKGERHIFKTCYKWLCEAHPEDAIRTMEYIAPLGRWDYILVALHTPVEPFAVTLIKEQLKADEKAEHPSLLAKWLPSPVTHGKKNSEASYIAKKLGLNQKQYRKLLSGIRKKIHLVETTLSEKDYDNLNFETVPTKAMLKYRNAFNTHAKEQFEAYKSAVASGKKKINTKGLFCYEIVQKILRSGNWNQWNWNYDESKPLDTSLFNLMWENQKDFLADNKTNVLVMADTSGSMTEPSLLPIANSLGLAIYTAERNHGYFHNYFMTFSSEPQLQKIIGESITQKVNSIKSIIEETNVDKAFELLLNTAIKNHISNDDMPSHIIIISDMEFDEGCYSSLSFYSKGRTNFSGWKEAFEEAGYTMPKIIFWNVAANTNGFPVTKYDQDVCMISGFSTSVLSNILNLEEYSPIDAMMQILEPYIDMLAE